MTRAPADAAFLAQLRAALPDGTLRAVEPRYLEEPRGWWRGRAAAVVAPATVAEVAATVRLAAAARVGIVPYGGGTGLVGGQVAPDGPAPILVSLERMTAIREVRPEEDAMIVEAGAILADVQAAARAAGRLFPLSYGAEGSARIGGALSVNSGGHNVLRYGTARDLCLGLEAVLPDGQVWHGLRRLRKDNTGYDLRHLLIGAEGTLGVITAASLRLYPRPARQATGLLAVPSPAAALALLGRMRAQAGEAVSAFELISGQGPRFVAETRPEVRQPLDPIPDWLVLVDLATAATIDPAALLEDAFAAAHAAGEVSDGILAQSEAQAAGLWALREAIPRANRQIGAVASHDVALPLGAVAEFLTRADAAVAAQGVFRVNAFGHLGDGNIHYNVFPEKGGDRRDHADRAAGITEAIHDIVAALGGSFSAEHGVGRLKVGELERYGDTAKLWAMRRIKAALDPLGIMNPGAVLRDG